MTLPKSRLVRKQSLRHYGKDLEQVRDSEAQMIYLGGGQLPSLSLKVYELDGIGPKHLEHLDRVIRTYQILKTGGNVGVAILTGFQRTYVLVGDEITLLPEERWSTVECCSLTLFSRQTVFDWHFAGGRRPHIETEPRQIVPVLANFYLKDGKPVDTGVDGGIVTEALHIPGDEAKLFSNNGFDEKRFLYKEGTKEVKGKEPEKILIPRFAVEMEDK